MPRLTKTGGLNGGFFTEGTGGTHNTLLQLVIIGEWGVGTNRTFKLIRVLCTSWAVVAWAARDF